MFNIENFINRNLIMSIWRTLIRHDSLILLFVILLFVNLRSCQGQGLSFKDNCKNYGLTCIVYNKCPNANELIKGRKAQACGFENEALRKNVKICCNLPNKNDTTTTTSTTPIPSEDTPYIRLEETPSSRNATAIALQKCQEYSQLQFVNKYLSPQKVGDKGYYYKIEDCVNVETLVIGGSPATPKEYPHMALIGYGNKFSEVEWSCGGSLISDRFILSAAHCGKNSALGPPRWALLGDLVLSSTKDESKPATYSIVRIYDHPDYISPSHYNDISLFELNTTVEMNPYVRPACLHTSTTDLKFGDKASVSGWGKTDTGERNTSKELLKVSVAVIEDETCKRSYEKLPPDSKLANGYDTDGMICAGDLINGNDTCLGDSGGPLQTIQGTCMWKIVGVTSFGPSICGNREDPGVYTRVANYLSWIQSIVWPS